MRGRRGRRRGRNHRFSLIDFLSTYTEPNLEAEMAKQAKDYVDSCGIAHSIQPLLESTTDLWQTYQVTTTTGSFTGMMPIMPKPDVQEQLDIKKPEDIGQVVDSINKLLRSLLPKTIIYTIQKIEGKDQLLINFDLTALKSDDDKERIILFDDEE